MGIGGNQPSKKMNIFRQPYQNFKTLIESKIGSFAFTSPRQSKAEQRFVTQSTGSKVIGRRENQDSSNKGVSLSTASLNQVLWCINCRKFHHGECRQGFGGCFRCGQMGHQRKDCPRNAQARGLPPKPNAP